MSEVSNSTLSWLDTSEHERRMVLQLVSALNEPGTLDELGIGSIRDTFSDELFPGTSTIQTRARYFLFVPWIMQMVEASSTSNPANHARWLQWKLCNALVKSHGADPGVIGREAGATLQRWPVDIYWLGMARWGIRKYPGSISSYLETLRRPSSWNIIGQALEEPVEGRRDEASEGVAGNWANLPSRPDDFPWTASFALTEEEGGFLSPNPPKDTDGRREDSGRGVRELQGRWPGLHWGRWEVGGRSSVAAQGPYGRLRELRCAGWREDTQQGTLADRGGASLRGRWVSRRLAVRPGVEWLAAGPGRD